MRAASVSAALAALVLAGCGGGSAPPPPHHIHLTPFEKHGKALYIQKCGACHTLADAGTGGIAGPPLDSPWLASRVRELIADGPAGMPPGIVTGTDADAVAAYVAAATK